MAFDDPCWHLGVPAPPEAWNRIVFSRVGSTNTVGKQIARDSLQEELTLLPTMIAAMEQFAGRGRQGREWISPAGGIYVTLVLPVSDPDSQAALPLTVATALCSELDGIVEPGCGLEWPNDLVVESRKLGGILIEGVGRGSSFIAIIGFGINYYPSGSAVLARSTSIVESATDPPSLRDLMHRLIDSVAQAVVQEIDRERAVEKYVAWSVHEIGEVMSCRTLTETHRGEFLGFDRRGFLRLRTAEGEIEIAAGDLVESVEEPSNV